MPERVVDLHAPDPPPRRALKARVALALVEEDERESVRGRRRAEFARGGFGGEQVSLLDRAGESCVCRALAGHCRCRWGDGCAQSTVPLALRPGSGAVRPTLHAWPTIRSIQPSCRDDSWDVS